MSSQEISVTSYFVPESPEIRFQWIARHISIHLILYFSCFYMSIATFPFYFTLICGKIKV